MLRAVPLLPRARPESGLISRRFRGALTLRTAAPAADGGGLSNLHSVHGTQGRHGFVTDCIPHLHSVHDGWGETGFVASCRSERPQPRPNSRTAFSLSTSGRTSSRIGSFSKSESHRSGVIRGKSDPNSILSRRRVLMYWTRISGKYLGDHPDRSM